MSNKVYVIQPSNLSYNLRQPTRQTAPYPHVAKPTQMVTVVKNKIPQYNDFEDDTIDSDFIDMDSPQQKQPRRRERLNHLSQEEKLNRRKMKNREAAQNARDRKKEQGKKMEHTVRQLMNENRRLKAENAKLRAAMNRLNGADCPQQTMPPQQQYIPTETHSLAPTTLSVNSSSPLSTVESAALLKTNSLQWIRAMTSSTNRHLCPVNVLKSTQRTRPAISKLKRTTTTNRRKSGALLNLIKMSMFLMHQSNSNNLSATSSSHNNSSTTVQSRPMMILSNRRLSTNFALNSTSGTTTHALSKKWKQRRRPSLTPRSTTCLPMR